MTRAAPPLETRAAVLRAWSTAGTPSDILRRLQGATDRATVRSVQRWAEMGGHLRRRPPAGLILSTTGRDWLSDVASGRDPDPMPRPYARPTSPPRGRPSRPRRIQSGSIPHRVLAYLAANGSDCVAEMADYCGIKRRRVANSCRTLQINNYVSALGQHRTIRGPHGLRPAVVLTYTITADGRAALEAV